MFLCGNVEFEVLVGFVYVYEKGYFLLILALMIFMRNINSGLFHFGLQNATAVVKTLKLGGVVWIHFYSLSRKHVAQTIQ